MTTPSSSRPSPMIVSFDYETDSLEDVTNRLDTVLSDEGRSFIFFRGSGRLESGETERRGDSLFQTAHAISKYTEKIVGSSTSRKSPSSTPSFTATSDPSEEERYRASLDLLAGKVKAFRKELLDFIPDASDRTMHKEAMKELEQALEQLERAYLKRLQLTEERIKGLISLSKHIHGVSIGRLLEQ